MVKVARRTVNDVIEDLGVGQAQVRNVVLGHGIWFVEGAQINMSMGLAIPIAESLALTSAQKASLSSLIFVGIALGACAGGVLSDKLGRLPSLLACYALTAAAQLLTALSGSYWVLAALRVLMGCGQGLGMPSSLALVNETTPEAYRVLAQGLRGCLFACGPLFAALLFVADDPTSYRGLHWRTQLALSSALFLLLGLFAWCLLRESPAYLAHCGQHHAARAELDRIRRLNGRLGGSGWGHVVGYDETEVSEPPEGGAATSASGSNRGWQELSVVFGRHLRSITFALGLASFMCNVMLYGHMYMWPKVASEVNSTLLPGCQALMQACLGLASNSGVLFVAAIVGCRSMLGMGMSLGVAGPLLLAWTGGFEDRSWPQEGLYLAAQSLPQIAASACFLGCFQLSVDLYPVRGAATSAAVCVATGRLGSILAPYVCEAMGSWQLFYGLLSVLSCASLSVTMAVLLRNPLQHAEVMSIADSEVRP